MNLVGKHIAAFDGFRGLAILMVAWYHLWQQSWWSVKFDILGHNIDLDFLATSGWLGVDAFLFISGFCLFYPYVLAKESGLEINWKHYFFRRFLKILPSYVLAVTIMFAAEWHQYKELSTAIKDYLLHIFFLQELLPFTTIKFGGGVFWSLAVEMQFYFLFPLLAGPFCKRPLLSSLILIFLAMSFRLGTYLSFPPASILYYHFQLPGFLDLYAFGMLAAIGVHRLRKTAVPPWLWTGISILALVTLFITTYIMHLNRWMDYFTQYFRTYYGLGIGLLFLVFAISTALSFRMWEKLVANPLLVFLSGVSYNWYIWHQFVAIKLRQGQVIKSNTTLDVHDPNFHLPMFLLSISLSLWVATLVSYWFERPILNIQAPWPKTKPLDLAKQNQGPDHGEAPRKAA